MHEIEKLKDGARLGYMLVEDVLQDLLGSRVAAGNKYDSLAEPLRLTLDMHGDGRLGLREFVMKMAHLEVRGEYSDVAFAFELFKPDAGGYVDRDTVLTVLDFLDRDSSGVSAHHVQQARKHEDASGAMSSAILAGEGEDGSSEISAKVRKQYAKLLSLTDFSKMAADSALQHTLVAPAAAMRSDLHVYGAPCLKVMAHLARAGRRNLLDVFAPIPIAESLLARAEEGARGKAEGGASSTLPRP